MLLLALYFSIFCLYATKIIIIIHKKIKKTTQIRDFKHLHIQITGQKGLIIYRFDIDKERK